MTDATGDKRCEVHNLLMADGRCTCPQTTMGRNEALAKCKGTGAGVEAPQSRAAPLEGDAYFFVGYEDTPGFAIARTRDEVRAALCEVIYGGSLTPADEETKEEIDAHMEWFEDDDRWSIDRSHWSVRYEIGGLECWRFPAKMLAALPRSATGEMWTLCHFIGDPPAGYESWHAFCEAKVKTGVRVEALPASTKSDEARREAYHRDVGAPVPGGK